MVGEGVGDNLVVQLGVTRCDLNCSSLDGSVESRTHWTGPDGKAYYINQAPFLVLKITVKITNDTSPNNVPTCHVQQV